MLDKHNKAKNQINTLTKYIECPQLLKQQLFFIEEKNNAYKMSSYFTSEQGRSKNKYYPKNSQVVDSGGSILRDQSLPLRDQQMHGRWVHVM